MELEAEEDSQIQEISSNKIDFVYTTSISKQDETEYENFVKGRISYLFPGVKQNWEPLTNEVIYKYQKRQMKKDKRLNSLLRFSRRRKLFVYKHRIFIPTKLLNYIVYQNHIANYHGSKETERLELVNSCYFTDQMYKVEDLIEKVRQNCLHCH